MGEPTGRLTGRPIACLARQIDDKTGWVVKRERFVLDQRSIRRDDDARFA